MMKVRIILVVVMSLVALLPSGVFAQSGAKLHTPSLAPHELTARILEFTPNLGQLSDQFGRAMPEVLYTAEARGVKFYFTATGVHFVFRRAVHVADSGSRAGRIAKNHAPSHDTLSLCRMDVDFVGANPNPTIEATDTTDAYRNYFLNGSRIMNVHSVKRLMYRDLYPKIDMVLYGNDSVPMIYDFIVHPGGDPNQIRMRYSGQDSLELLRDGSFATFTPFGRTTEAHPFSYQSGSEGNEEIPSQFHLEESDLQIVVGSYDTARDLVIDPLVLWGTYFGGADEDYGFDLGIDRNNNIAVCGYTSSLAQIATTGAYKTVYAGGVADAYVAEFYPSGNLKWATYFGGPSLDYGNGIAVDSNGSIALCGLTESATGIATASAFRASFIPSEDAFLAKFDSNGALLWSTYFGGGGEYWYGDDAEHSVASDAAGNFYITGATSSTSNLATNGAYQTSYGGLQDAYLAMFGPDGKLHWATYYGGSSMDAGNAVATNNRGQVVMVGGTSSTSGIASGGAVQGSFAGNVDGFVTAFDSTGKWLWGTYYGGEEADQVYGVATDLTGSIYCTGITGSVGGISTPGSYQPQLASDPDAFLLKLNSAGSRIWSTYYGGNNVDYGWGVTVSGASVYLVGETQSTNNIATRDGFDTALDQEQSDAFLVRFTPGGSRLWSTYYGGSDHDAGFAVGGDHLGAIIFTGQAGSPTGIATTGAYQTQIAGAIDAFVVKICGIFSPLLIASRDTLCHGFTDTISLSPSYGRNQWFENGTHLTSADNASQYVLPDTLAPGLYNLYAVVEDLAGCNVTSDTLSIVIGTPPTVVVGALQPICEGDSVQLTAIGSGIGTIQYQWTPTTGLSNSAIANPRASPESTTTYSVSVMDQTGCVSLADSIKVVVNVSPTLTAPRSVQICSGSAVLIGAPATLGATPYFYSWTPAAGLSSTNAPTTVASPSATTTYIETVTDANGCHSSDSITVNVVTVLKDTLIASGPLVFCEGDSVTLDAGAGFAHYQWLDSGKNIPNATNETLLVKATGIYSAFVTNGGSCQDSSNSVLVRVNQNPAIPVITRVGAELVSNIAAHYQWLLDSTVIIGAIGDTILSPQAGNYSVTIVNSNGCSSTSLPFYYQPDSGMTVVAVPPLLEANPGSPVAMPLELLSSTDLAASGAMHFTAKIRLNNTLLAPTGATPAVTIQGNDLVVTISGTNPLPLGTTSGTLATLNFLATLGNDTCTPVTIDEFIWTDGNKVTVTTQNGEFCLTGVCVAGGTLRLINPNTSLSLSEPHPNPATSQTEVDYALDEQGETDLYIVDMLGREVRHVINGIQLPGNYSATFEMSGLAQGTYIYILRTPSGQLSHVMQVVR